MANIVLMPIHWAANLNASFALARGLVRRGHRVHFLCLPDTEDRVRSQGFDFTPIFGSTFPKGTLPKQYAGEAIGTYLGADGFKARIRGMCQSMLEGELQRSASALRADLILVSTLTPWVTIGAWRTGVPVASYSSSLISVPDPHVPPFGTGQLPGRSPVSRIATRLAWRRFFLRRRFLQPEWDISRLVTEFATRCEYPLERIDGRVETWPRVAVPTLVLCPKEFDFPRSRVPAGVHFVEPGVDLQRTDSDFPWERLPADKPIVFCAMGSVATHKYAKEAGRFFEAFIEALARRPRWQGVVAIGHHLRLEGLPCPQNVVAVREAPQLQVLRRASLSVTHAGFSSVKESILMGVPMVVLPLFYDQPGTAARIVYHGLGVRARFSRVSALVLGRLMETVMHDPAYRERTERMSATFSQTQARFPSAEIIESLIAHRAPAGVLPRGARARRQVLG